MNLIAKIRSLQAQIDELRARIQELERPAIDMTPNTPATNEALSKVHKGLSFISAIAQAAPIASATIAPPPAKRRGRPPKPKV